MSYDMNLGKRDRFEYIFFRVKPDLDLMVYKPPLYQIVLENDLYEIILTKLQVNEGSETATPHRPLVRPGYHSDAFSEYTVDYGSLHIFQILFVMKNPIILRRYS